MAATIMRSTISKIYRIKEDFPQFNFKFGRDFFWSSVDNTIYYTNNKDQSVLLLHELSHALLGHNKYLYDIELISMERQAWDYAKLLAPKYGLEITDQFIQTHLETYREWIHLRSTCPSCSATGIQDKLSYKCIACKQNWVVNDARDCNLKRYTK